METKKASRITWKHVIFCIVLLILFVFTIGIHTDAEGNNEGIIANNDSEVVPLQFNTSSLMDIIEASNENEVKIAGPKEEVTEVENKLESYITTYADKFEFYSQVFGVSSEDIYTDLRERHENSDKGFKKQI